LVLVGALAYAVIVLAIARRPLANDLRFIMTGAVKPENAT
jgi:hypothetical protein